MAEISRFFGIIIVMYYQDHGIPHFHAKYNDQWGVFSISELKMITGKLPKRVISMVLEWAFEHREELLENWERVQTGKPTKKIAPLV